MSVDVAGCREPSRGSRQILERVGKILETNGGDDWARTRDLRRDRKSAKKGVGSVAESSIYCGNRREPFGKLPQVRATVLDKHFMLVLAYSKCSG